MKPDYSGHQCIIGLCVFTGILGLDLLFCFSVRQNMAHLNQDLSNRVDILRSMRFICTCIVILYHRAGNFGASPLWNLEFLENVSESVKRHYGC